jgi:hypothetical protein
MTVDIDLETDVALALAAYWDDPHADCLAVGVGGVHSDAFFDDGRCQWCGADPAPRRSAGGRTG